MNLKSCLLPVVLLLTSISIHCQILHADGQRPSFEVATIKPIDGAPPPSSAPPALPHDEVLLLLNPKVLIGIAYNIQGFVSSEIVGGPGWIDGQMYQIQAKISGPLSDAMQKMSSKDRKRQMQLMEQSLLADRFKLKVHFETRRLPQYALVVTKGGPKLPAAAPSAPHRDTRSSKGQGEELKATGCTMENLAGMLQNESEIGGRVVVDQTGLTGLYNVILDWIPNRIADANPDASGPSLFTALREQLGLRLVETKGPVKVVVIDHIERPSEN